MSRPVDPRLRDRLLAAATSVFAECGYARASMVEIGRRAGVTKGGVYFHFRTKESLFFAVLDARRARVTALLGSAAQTASRTALDALRGLLGAYFDFHFDEPDSARLSRVLESELRDAFTTTLREDVAHEQRMLRARIRDLLVRGNREGSLFAADPSFGAFVVASAVRGIVDQWLTAPADVEPFCRTSSLVDEVLGTFSSGAGRVRRPDGEADHEQVGFHPFA